MRKDIAVDRVLQRDHIAAAVQLESIGELLANSADVNGATFLVPQWFQQGGKAGTK